MMEGYRPLKSRPGTTILKKSNIKKIDEVNNTVKYSLLLLLLT